MSIENKICSQCRYLDRYYTKGETKFNKTEYGWCPIKRESVSINGCCDKYAKRTARGISKRAKVYLNDLLTELSEIRKIMETESEE